MAEQVFRVALYWFPEFREYMEAKLGQTEPRGPHETPGRALVPRGPLLHLLVPSQSFQGLLYPEKKSPQSFVAFGLRLVLIFSKTKNRQKTTTSTRH